MDSPQERSQGHRDDITSMNYAAKGVANVSKNLLGDCEELRAVQKFAANVRNMHYSMTMPWSDNGSRLLTTKQYFKYNEVMTDLQNEFRRLVDVRSCRSMSGRSRKPKPSWVTCLTVTSTPRVTVSSPSSASAYRTCHCQMRVTFRIDIGNEAMTQIKSQYEAHYTQAIQTAMNDIWHKLHDNLTTLVRQLDVNDEGKGNRLYDSVFDRALELIEMLGTCNVTQDTQMEAMRQKLEQALYGLNLEQIKNSPSLREDTRKNLNAALAALPSLDM
jgi:hypothetical protein